MIDICTLNTNEPRMTPKKPTKPKPESAQRERVEVADPLLTVQEAAELMGLRVGTLYQWAYLRRVPTVKLGRALRFHRSVVEGLIERGKRPALGPDQL